MVEYNKLIKILLIGETFVDKTSIMNRFVDNYFDNKYISTFGADFKIKYININKDNIKLQIWDIAGNDEHKIISSIYYYDINYVIYVFDLSNEKTFKKIEEIKNNIKKYFWINDYKLIIVGNKKDLIKKNNNNNFYKYLSNCGHKYIYTSAKNNYGIEELFNYIIIDKLIIDNKDNKKCILI